MSQKIGEMTKYKGKYRGDTTRWKCWDYSWNAAYFITIITKNRERFFGRVISGEMQLSNTGRLAHECWLAIPEHFPFVKLGAHIIMPDHTHGIVIIDKPTEGQDIMPRDCIASPSGKSKNKFGPQSQNLASIIRGFKVGVTKGARQIHPHFSWQPRYHDHVIRDERAYRNISQYILNNPQKWQQNNP